MSEVYRQWPKGTLRAAHMYMTWTSQTNIHTQLFMQAAEKFEQVIGTIKVNKTH